MGDVSRNINRGKRGTYKNWSYESHFLNCTHYHVIRSSASSLFHLLRLLLRFWVQMENKKLLSPTRQSLFRACKSPGKQTAEERKPESGQGNFLLFHFILCKIQSTLSNLNLRYLNLSNNWNPYLLQRKSFSMQVEFEMSQL